MRDSAIYKTEKALELQISSPEALPIMTIDATLSGPAGDARRSLTARRQA